MVQSDSSGLNQELYYAQLFAKIAEHQLNNTEAGVNGSRATKGSRRQSSTSNTHRALQQHGMVRRDQVNGGIKYLPR